jgi:acyl-CoA hydrolase
MCYSTLLVLTHMEGKPVSASYSDYTELALPNDANSLGNLLGGKVMHLVDLAGAMAAMRHSRHVVVTASIDQMHFLHPVKIGQWVRLRSAVNRVFRTSMEVGVKVWMEDLVKGEMLHTCSAYLTFVALDSAGKPVAVPAAVPETEIEKMRYEAAGVRRAYRLTLRKS